MSIVASRRTVRETVGPSRNEGLMQAMDLRSFSKLIADIYAGISEDLPWRAALETLRSCLDANYVFLTLRSHASRDNDVQVIASQDKVHLDYPEFWSSEYALDPFVNLPRDRVVTVDELMGDAWRGSAFFKQFVEPSGIRYILGADIRSESGTECRLRISRPPTSRNFTSAEKALCQSLLPHIARALHFHARLDSIDRERRLFANAIDRMLVGVIILDERGRVFKMNSAAQLILGEQDGIEIVRGLLTATYFSDENRELRRLITQAINSIAGANAPSVLEAVSVTRPSGKQKLGVLVRAIPVGQWEESQHRPAAVVLIRDSERRATGSYDVARKLFELTPAESELAMRLANGLSLEEAADELGIRKNTARAQLRSIFVKIGVTNQSSLVRRLLNSVMYLE